MNAPNERILVGASLEENESAIADIELLIANAPKEERAIVELLWEQSPRSLREGISLLRVPQTLERGVFVFEFERTERTDLLEVRRWLQGHGLKQSAGFTAPAVDLAFRGHAKHRAWSMQQIGGSGDLYILPLPPLEYRGRICKYIANKLREKLGPNERRYLAIHHESVLVRNRHNGSWRQGQSVLVVESG